MQGLDFRASDRLRPHGWGNLFEKWRELVFAEGKPRKSSGDFRAVDLFSSVGGLSLGAQACAADHQIGYQSLLACEIDTRALQVFERNFRPRRVTSRSAEDLAKGEILKGQLGWHLNGSLTAQRPLLEISGTIDLVTAGPPCQGHSGFNNKSRRTDPRNSLYLSAVRAAIAANATAVVIENVPQVKSSHLDVVSASVDILRATGYTVDDGVLSAHELGWPQTRKRHFLVASRRRLTPLRDLAEIYREEPPGSLEFLKMLPKRGGIMDELPEYSEDTQRRLDFFDSNIGIFDLPLYERPDCHRKGTTYKSVYGRIKPEDPFPTITSGFMTPGRGRFVHPAEPRTLTPSEAAYVQGFPSWFDFCIEGVNRSELQKWIGDAVPLPLGYIACMAVIPGLIE